MNLLLVGLNHRTAPVEVRERLAFSREGAAAALMLFRRQFPGCEAAILSTCNRVEVLVSDGDSDENDLRGPMTADRVIAFLSRVRDVPEAAFRDHLYRAEGAAAVRHVFHVISGLDSLVVGESQIVNQLKQAYALANEQGTVGPVLHRLFHHAFGVSKRVRTETGITDGKVSVPSLAIDVIRRTVPDYRGKRILIVGAGEMARLSIEYLRAAAARDFVVTTRTMANAKALAEACNGRAVPFAELDEQLALADVVITATSCPTAILTADRVRRAASARGGRPLLLVDLAVPRNVDPAVTLLPGVTLHDVDTLGRLVADTRRRRRSQAAECQQTIDEEVAAFEKWVAEAKFRPIIEQMFEDVRELAAIEVRGLFRRCPELSDGQQEAVRQMADRLVGKLLHPCVCTVRQQGALDSAAALAQAFRETRFSFDERVKAGTAARRPPGGRDSAGDGRELCGSTAQVR